MLQKRKRLSLQKLRLRKLMVGKLMAALLERWTSVSLSTGMLFAS
jgi:hypothetical protein